MSVAYKPKPSAAALWSQELLDRGYIIVPDAAPKARNINPSWLTVE